MFALNYSNITTSHDGFRPSTVLVSLCFIFCSLYGLYQWLLPKPIPGIAFNPEATKSLLGDLPAMIKEVTVTGEFRVWCAKQVRKMNSPICQIFIRPFGEPWILLSDYRESRDILTRRREFDKSSFLSDGMISIGSFHGRYITGDEFKANRQLIQDLMTSTFLNSHVGPAAYKKSLELMCLFNLKMDAAQGRPFSVKEDFEYTSIDVMMEFAFGGNWLHTALGPQLQTWWWSKEAWYRKIFDEKERVLKEQVLIGLQNYREGHVETGIEHMIMREASRADKEGRAPNFESKIFRDEMFGNIIGGHHTTSGAMMWLTKYLTDNPCVQDKLRSVLYATLSLAREEKRLFTFSEIRQAKLPYLDAVIEEMLRINAVPVTREALYDTTILGCPIKKGTQVFFMSNGPGFLTPPLAVDESRRRETSRVAKMKAEWDASHGLASFIPERWLVRKNNGNGLLADDVEFDGAAGPQLGFGLGPRACWGRRLAYLEMRVVIAMLVWQFQLLETPAGLSSHAGLEGIARVPQQCYVRLRKIE
ncbi:hypothetical protein ONZ43_g849 [Nemania bipapillata]|uniref:Uncharacterized protein n=1 Tax=Nemania bipapillata TaxID=110536 RepID=A0ACC2J6T6_9PEZI|nr:hypothetical protein ONZ43_g849 [Nemania bipapillata]